MINTKKLDSYIQRCFEDAFKAEDRDYDKKYYKPYYIIIYDHENNGHFYPLFKCGYNRVERRVNFRLKNNLKKNFDLIYGDTYDFRVVINKDKVIDIDYNFTRAVLKSNKGIYYCISIIDDNDEIPLTLDINPFPFPSYRYGMLVATYMNLPPEELVEKFFTEGKAEDYHLPYKYRTDWEWFRSLWESTFNEPICPYNIIISNGLERL